MKRGGSSSGGKSSLGYLFGNDDRPNKPQPTPPALQPPYGTDSNYEGKTPENLSTPDPDLDNENPENPDPDNDRKNISNNYQRSQGQNLGNFLTGRPSTRVRSVPGGDSSLGYLFGDK